MLEDYISPGDRIELQAVQGAWTVGTDRDDSRIYTSKIADIISEDRLDMMMPIEKGKLILLPVDGEYNIFIYGRTGQYQCFGKIADRYRTNNMYMLTMDLLSGLQKMQRRAYYRFPCAFEMRCRELTDYEQLALSSNAFFEPNLSDTLMKGVIVDISGGGVRFVSVNRFEEGMVLYCIFKLPSRKKAEEYRVCIRILKIRELENRPDTFEYRAQYTIIDEDDREDIIRYIFEEERKIRKKQDNG